MLAGKSGGTELLASSARAADVTPSYNAQQDKAKKIT